MTKTLMKAGYTVQVTSWENDADNYNTTETHVDTKEKALALRALANMASSCYHAPGQGFGNASSMSRVPDGLEKATNFILSNPSIFPDKIDTEDEDAIQDYFDNNINELLGYSEYYAYRVCESVQIWYTPEDLIVEVL